MGSDIKIITYTYNLYLNKVLINILKLIFELYPEDGRIKPYEYPYDYIFRGVIMKWLHEIKPALIHQLHSYEEIRPYSINCIIYKKVPKIDFMIISMDDNLSDILLQDLISTERAKLKIGQKDYFISNVKFERINIKEQIIDKSRPIRDFNIHFVKPVYFNTSMGDYPVRFPIPLLFFGNLANIWNENISNICKIERKSLLKWINAHVYVSGYKLKTVKAEIGKNKPMAGAIGNASYRITKINKNYYSHYLEELNKQHDIDFINNDYINNGQWLEILCRLGEYTNVGANRTAGMGVIRYYPKRYLDANII